MDINKPIIMRNIIFIIAIIFLFSCKKEKMDTTKGISLVGKLKAKSETSYKYEYIYNDTTGLLQKIKYYGQTDTSLLSFIERKESKIYIHPYKPELYNDYYDISINQAGLIKSFKSWNKDISSNLYTVSYTNKLNYFTDSRTNFILGNGKYYNFKMVDGNYISFVHKSISDWGTLRIDTFDLTYTNLPYNKYAPQQKFFLMGDEFFDFLGFDDIYLFPPNKNLIKSMGGREFEYDFNSLNQLIKMRVIDLGVLKREYTFEYY